MSGLPSFVELAAAPETPLDLLALGLAAEFRDVDAHRATATLGVLASELSHEAGRTNGTPDQLTRACARLLGGTHGFVGDHENYDHPENSMLDVVLLRRRGLPILLSVVYIEVARRAEIPLAGVGLPGHFVVGHFGTTPPLLLDPFTGGDTIDAVIELGLIRPWNAQEIVMRMLNNLTAAYDRRGDLARAIHAAALRLTLPADRPLRDTLQAELRALRARLN